MIDKPLNKTVIAIAAPAVAELVLTSLSQIVDTIMVGGIGAYAIAAVGLTNQPRFIMLAAFIALNVGTTALMARFRGAGDKASADVVTVQSIMLTAVVAAAITVPGWLFAPALMAAMGASADTLGAATEYFRITVLFFVPTALPLVISALLRGVGDTKISLRFNVAANLVNLLFDWLLIYGNLGFPALGVRGAAYATVLGNLAACAWAFLAISGKKAKRDESARVRVLRPLKAARVGGRVGARLPGIDTVARIQARLARRPRSSDFVEFHFKLSNFRPNAEMLARIVRIGLPSAGEQLALRIGLLIFTVMISTLGTTVFAAHQIVLSLLNMSFVNGQAFGIAAASLTGQALGRGDPDGARKAARAAQLQGMLISSLMGIFMFVFRYHLVLLFTRDEAIVALGASILILTALVQPFQSSFQVISGALRGAGDSTYPALSMAAGILAIRPALAFLFIHVLGWGLMGAWFALLVDQGARFGLIWLRFRSGKWVFKKV